MSAWKEYRFSAFVEINPQVSLKQGSTYSFVEMADLQDGNKFCDASTIRAFNGSGTKFRDRDTLFARITPCLENGKICQVRNLTNNTGFGSTEFYVFRGREGVSDTDFIFYLARWSDVRDYAEANFHGTSGRQRVPRESFDNFFLKLPLLPEQRAIAGVLSSLDDKIDLLHRQNKTLEGMAEALWRKMFVQEADPGWDKKGLDEIATFLNGLPCQKYPPDTSTEPLPVIKIKELRTGITDDSDLATSKVPPEYIVDDGDILFSWSGSLEIVIWSFGKGLLNQHLFKVTSADYPKWFCYFWIKHHLAEFRDIAQDKATTMGHIQRHHLSAANVLIPDEKAFEYLNTKISPVFEKMIHNLKAIREFARLRDILLPKLMSGEVRVKV